MGRLLSVLVGVILSTVTLSAHDPFAPSNPYRFSVRLFGAVSTMYQSDLYESENPHFIKPSTIYSTKLGLMEYIYSDWSEDVKSSPLLGGDFAWTPYKWLTLKGNVTFSYFSHNNYSSLSGNLSCRSRGAVVSIVPEVQLNYMNTSWFRMYIGAGLGLGAYMGFGSDVVLVDGQINLLGLEIGKKIFGFVESGFGTLYMGCKFGVGYRF